MNTRNLFYALSLITCGLSCGLLTGCSTDDGDGGGGGNGNNAPVINSLQVGNPVCSTTGGGAVDGKVFPGSKAWVDVFPACTNGDGHMYVWLQANAQGVNQGFYDWRIGFWSNSFPHGRFDQYSSVVRSNAATGEYIVRTTTNRVRYVSQSDASLERLTAVFKEFVSVSAFSVTVSTTTNGTNTSSSRTTNGTPATGYFTINLMGVPDDNSPSLLVSEGFRPHLSPDGKRFVFLRMSDYTTSARSEVWLAETNGQGLRQLTGGSDFSDYSPQFAPDGQTIVFIRKPGSYNTNTLGTLWQIRPDGSGAQIQASYSGVREFCFYVHSAGTNIIVDDGTLLRRSVSLWPAPMDLSSSTLSGTFPRSAAEPTEFSPDIVVFDPQFNTVSVVNPISISKAPLSAVGRFTWPALSPKGSNIITGLDSKTSPGLYTIPKNLVQNTAPTRRTVLKDFQPTWSKTTVVFVNLPYTDSTLEHGDIIIVKGLGD